MEIMDVKWRIFRTLMWKNYLSRKRHWKQIIFAQMLLPLCIFVFLQKLRSPRWISSENELVTYYPIETKENLLKETEDFYLHYTPKNNFTEQLIERTIKCLSLSPNNVTAFSSEEAMLKNYSYEHGYDMYDVKILGIIFQNTNTEKELDYVLRSSFDTPDNVLEGIFQGYGHYYLRECFTNQMPYIQTQMCLDESFINMSAPNPSFTYKVTIQRFPDDNATKLQPRDGTTIFLFATSAIFLFLLTGFTEGVYPLNEKYTGINILMNLKGIQFHMNLLSWFATGLLQGIFFSTLIIIVMTQCFDNPVLFYGNSFIIWLFMVFHFGHLTAFGMHFSSYFTETLTMEVVMTIVYIGASMFQAELIDNYTFALIPYLGIIFPNILLYRMFEEMSNYETLAVGVQWTSMFRVLDTRYTAAGSIGVIIIFSIFGTALHFFSCVYIHTVFPGKFGLKYLPISLFQKKDIIYNELQEELDEFNYANENGKPFEQVPKGVFTPGIQIRNVKKSFTRNLFNRKEYEVLHGISLDAYKGQITTLLGRNRSGKTTLLTILTGLSKPTEGVVFIDGKRINDFFKYMSTDLSICPEGNMLFFDLTVMEHIEFFGLLNCMNKTEEERKMIYFNVEKLMKRLNIYDKRNLFSKDLSIAERRKLSLGMSLISDSKILILDEPTSGMDSEDKRNIWNMLLDMKGEKTIFISTKDAEEADTLSDKIAILHQGTLKGYGTSTFLKKFYGQGNIEVTLSVTTWCNTEAIRQELGVPSENLRLEEETMILCLPCSEKLLESLDKIENQKREFGVTAIKVSLITLEQVVLKVTKKEEDIDLTRPFVNSAYKLKDRELLLQSALALIEKNVTYVRRNLITLLAMLALPLLSSIFTIMSISSTNEVRDLRHISLDLYNEPEVMLATNNKSLSQESKIYVNSFNVHLTEIDSDINMNDALVKFSTKDITAYQNNLVTAIEFNVTEKAVNANALYSNTAKFSMPIGINMISNVLLKQLAGDGHSIYIFDHPFPRLRTHFAYDISTLALLFTVFLYPAIAFFGIHPSQEISSGLKHLQTMTGIPTVVYWACQFAVDFIVFLVLIIFCLIGLIIVDHVVNLQLYCSTELAIMTLLLILLGINALPMAYIFSYTKMSKSNVVFTLGLLPFVLLLVEAFFWIIDAESQAHYHGEVAVKKHSTFLVFREIQKRLFQLIPHISFFHGQVAFLRTAVGNAHCRYLVQHDIADHFFEEYCEGLECHGGTCKKSLPYFGRDPKFSEAEIKLEECLTFLCLTPFLYIGILAVIEYKFIQKLYARYFMKGSVSSNVEMDEQVREEKYTVGFEVNKLRAECASNKANKLVTETRVEGDNVFLAYELNKCYKSKEIIKDVSFSVKSGECFGLLGVNSVGKSTIFKIITGEELPDNGDMFMKGYGISFNRREYLSQIGYCPQKSTLLGSLNARDHLRLFTQIRGIPTNQVNLEVEEWIKRLNLTECASHPCNTYTRGNRRCLNIAMAFIGNPDLILLDEPTIGIDAESRKSFWNMLKSFLRAGQSVIISSHCMEECEALCNRLAILAKGHLVGIGSSEELKKRFGTGYNIIIELNHERTEDQTNALKYDLENSISCEIRDEHLGNITYYVKNSETTWKTMYDLMKRFQQKYPCIVDFTILSATLEQVFLQFVQLKKE